MKIRFPLAVAAAAAATGLGVAQPIQLQVQQQRLDPPVFIDPVPYPTPEDGKPAKPGEGEYKPDANTDPNPKSLEVPAELQKKARDLTGKLGSRLYKERELATRELAKMGRMALPALYEAINSSTELEVAQRAEGLLPKAEAEDMKARVACFLADGDGKFNHTLPGWEKFKAVAGNDKASRELFAEALKTKLTHQMLLAADKSATEANQVLDQYVTNLWAMQNGGGFRSGKLGGGGSFQPKVADFAVALFLEGQFTDKEVVIQPTMPWGWGGNQYHTVINYLYSIPDVQNAVYGNNRSSKYSEPIRNLMVRWMDTRETVNGAYQAYNFAQNMFNRNDEDRAKLIKYAARVLEGESNMNVYYMKLSVLTNMGQLPNGRGKEALPAIAKCFDDTSIIWNWQNQNPAFDIQLRDYALAVALQITDQKPEDYGMSRTPGYGNGKNWSQQAFYFKDDNPNKDPNNGIGGPIRRPRRGEPVEPVEPEPKDPKKEEPKDPKKEEKKLSQDDRRKIAFAKWDEWVKENGITGDKKKGPKAEEPKKEEPKQEGPKPMDLPGTGGVDPLPALPTPALPPRRR